MVEPGLWLINATGERIALHTESGDGDLQLLEEYIEENIDSHTLAESGTEVQLTISVLRAVYGTKGPDDDEDAERFADSLRKCGLDEEVVRNAFQRRYGLDVLDDE